MPPGSSSSIEAAPAPPSLLAKELCRRYRNGRGLGPVDLSVRGGEVQALVGPNGSGKTTLLRLLATRTLPSSGDLSWFGGLGRERARAHLAVVFDQTSHAEELSPQQNLAFFATSRQVGTDCWDGSLEEAGLLELRDDRVSRLSYGMRRRLLLAEALVGEPELLLLDEPTLGLDVSGQRWLGEALRERARRGRATCVATNDTDFVEDVATRVAFLIEGRFVRDAPLAQLLEELGGLREIRVTYKGPSPAEALSRVAGVDRAADEGGTILLLAQRRQGLIPDLLGALGNLDSTLVDLKVRDPGLADCFLRLTGRSLHD
ncbi:MAG: ATP-binding cassette domain-containing protein [Candidatus Dormibacteria bacterium]